MTGGEHPDYPGRRRLLFGGLLGVPVCLAVAIAYFFFTSSRNVQEAVGVADRLDLGTQIQDREPKPAVIPANENDRLRLLIRDGHRASRDSIRTLHAIYVIESTDLTRNSEVTTYRAEWWQAGDRC
jgi:hypothetical protein